MTCINDTRKPPAQIDPRPVRELREVLGAAAVRDVLAKFTADAAVRLAAIDAAVAAHRIAELRDQLHTLKSTSATLGLVGLAGLAHALEAEADRIRVDAARVGALRALLDASIAALAASFPDLM